MNTFEAYIGDIFKVASGGTPNRKKPEYFDGGSIPWVKTGELKGKFANKPSEFITQTALENSSAKIFPPKTVLLAMYGATIGACSILDFEAATNQACAAILPSEDCNEAYLYYYLSSIKALLVNRGVGGAQPNISAGLIKKIKIPLPPLEEQKKIAAILDAADTLRQKNQQLIETYNTLSQSLFLSMFGDPVTNPMGWELSRIDSLCTIVRGSSPRPKGDPRYYGGNVPRLMVADLTRDGKCVTPKIDYLTEEGAKKSRPTKAGTVVMAVSGNVGLTSILAVDACIHDGFIAFNELDTNKILPDFFVDLMMFLKSTHASRQAGAIFKNLTTTQMKDMQVPLPPITLQGQFAKRIQAIEAQKQQAQEALQQSEDLFNSLLQRAFKGELTAQNKAERF